MKRRCYFIISIIIILILTTNCSRKNRVVAKFDGGVVYQREIDYYISRLPQNRQKEYLGSVENLKSIVEEIAEKKIVFEEAKKTNLVDFSNIMNEVKNYQKRELVRYMMDKLNIPVKAKVKFSDIKKFTSSIVVKLIWFKTYSGMSEKEIQRIRNRALKVKRLLNKGYDFGEMANKYSDDNGNFKGGRVGTINIDELPRDLKEKLLSLKPGQISDIFETKAGYEIVKLISIDKKSKPIKVEFRHILITTNNKGEQKALKKAQSALSLIKKGIDFSLVANEFTEDASNFNNGEIPKFRFSRIYYPIANTAYNLEPGEISDIIETKFGFFIVKLESIEKLPDENIERLKKNRPFLERIRRIKENYLKERNEYLIKRRIRRAYKIIENYSLLTNREFVSNTSIVAYIKDLDLKITYGDCVRFILGVSAPTFNLEFINKQERVYNSLIYPKISYDFALRKKFDKDEEFKLKLDEFLYNRVYQDYINSLSWKRISPDIEELKRYYKKNESRYYVTKVIDGKPRRVKQSFAESLAIVKRHYIQEKRNEIIKEWLSKLKKKYHLKVYTDRLSVTKNYKYYITVGDEFYKERKYKKAKKYYKKALKLEPTAGEAKLKLALVYYKLKKDKDAARIIDELQSKPSISSATVLSMLKEVTGEARAKLVELIGYLKDASAISPLIEIYTQTTNIEEKQASVRALGLLKAESAFDILLTDLREFDKKFEKYDKNRTSILKWYIIETIGYLGNKTATPLLMRLYRSTSDQNEKCFIIEALGRIKDKRAVPLLEKAYRTEVWGIRVLAAEALKKITGKEYKVEEPKESSSEKGV